MLATSSSDEDDYDQKKKPQSNKSIPAAGDSSSVGVFKQQVAQPNIGGAKPYNANFSPNHNRLNVGGTTQAISNMHLSNGGDTLSTRSSFSNSNSNEFINNRSNINMTGHRTTPSNSGSVFNSHRNASFKSNSSSSTMSGVTLMPGNLNSTPRVSKLYFYFLNF